MSGRRAEVRLDDRRVLLTGAGSGIGRSLALHFADRSAATVPVGRRVDALQETARLVGEHGGTPHVLVADPHRPR